MSPSLSGEVVVVVSDNKGSNGQAFESVGEEEVPSNAVDRLRKAVRDGQTEAQLVALFERELAQAGNGRRLDAGAKAALQTALSTRFGEGTPRATSAYAALSADGIAVSAKELTNLIYTARFRSLMRQTAVYGFTTACTFGASGAEGLGMTRHEFPSHVPVDQGPGRTAALMANALVILLIRSLSIGLVGQAIASTVKEGDLSVKHTKPRAAERDGKAVEFRDTRAGQLIQLVHFAPFILFYCLVFKEAEANGWDGDKTNQALIPAGAMSGALSGLTHFLLSWAAAGLNDEWLDGTGTALQDSVRDLRQWFPRAFGGYLGDIGCGAAKAAATFDRRSLIVAVVRIGAALLVLAPSVAVATAPKEDQQTYRYAFAAWLGSTWGLLQMGVHFAVTSLARPAAAQAVHQTVPPPVPADGVDLELQPAQSQK